MSQRFQTILSLHLSTDENYLGQGLCADISLLILRQRGPVIDMYPSNISENPTTRLNWV
jgi:hypothetical protein